MGARWVSHGDMRATHPPAHPEQDVFGHAAEAVGLMVAHGDGVLLRAFELRLLKTQVIWESPTSTGRRWIILTPQGQNLL